MKSFRSCLRGAALGIGLILLITSQADAFPKNVDKSLQIAEIRSPAGPHSGEANLFVDAEGNIYLSWVEKVGSGAHTLQFSIFQEGAWSEPETIAEGKNWFVNWADFPSVIAMGNGRLAAHWLAKSGEGTYAYDVHISQSQNGGKSWSPAIIPHHDGTETEHGFVSMLPWFNDRIFAVWLDGRNFAKAEGGHGSPSKEMTLRFASLDAAGGVHDETVLDARVCECCQTSAARTAGGAIAAYRDRSTEEIRDIAITRWVNGQWTAPQVLHADNWKFQGCPVNGPAVAAAGKHVAVAWFTAANDDPKIQIAFSSDEGETFGQAIQLNEGETVGRVDAVLLDDGSALVSWMQSTEQAGEIQICRVSPDGSKDLFTTLAKVSTGRASGFPQMARSGKQVYFAWTEVGNPAKVRTAVATLP